MEAILTQKVTYEAYVKAGLWKPLDTPKYVRDRKASVTVSAKLKKKGYVDIVVEITDYYSKDIYRTNLNRR